MAALVLKMSVSLDGYVAPMCSRTRSRPPTGARRRSPPETWPSWVRASGFLAPLTIEPMSTTVRAVCLDELCRQPDSGPQVNLR